MNESRIRFRARWLDVLWISDSVIGPSFTDTSWEMSRMYQRNQCCSVIRQKFLYERNFCVFYELRGIRSSERLTVWINLEKIGIAKFVDLDFCDEMFQISKVRIFENRESETFYFHL